MSRLLHYLLGYRHALWPLLYSDDGWLIGTSDHYEYDLLLFFFIVMVVKAPFA